MLTREELTQQSEWTPVIRELRERCQRMKEVTAAFVEVLAKVWALRELETQERLNSDEESSRPEPPSPADSRPATGDSAD